MLRQGEWDFFDVYIWVVLVLVALYVVWRLFFKVLNKVTRYFCCKANSEDVAALNDCYEADFYGCVNFETLYDELTETEKKIIIYSQMLDTDAYLKPHLTEDSLKAFILTLRQRKVALTAQLEMLFDQVAAK